MTGEGAFKFVKDLILPVFCVECGREGEWWCRTCLEKNKINFFNHNKAVSYLDGVTAFFVYNEEAPIGKLIKLYKYQFAREIDSVWKKIISSSGWRPAQICPKAQSAIIMPVPLHPRRLRERGFNQAEIIAQIIAGETNLSLSADALKRVKYTGQQAKLTAGERNRNLEGAFAWTRPYPPPDDVILTDDVYTTGATTNECAKILKSAGARRVWGVVLAAGQ
jgi:ComF family protein